MTKIDWYVGNVHEIMFSLTLLTVRDLDIAKYLIKAKLQHPNPKLHTTAITYAKITKKEFYVLQKY